MQPNQGLEMPAPELQPARTPGREPQAPARPEPRARPWKKLLWLLVSAAVVAYITWKVVDTRRANAQKDAGGPKPGQMAVPVTVAAVEVQPVPIYLDGLGTIQPLQTVTVRARVEGQIEKIAFTEGQDVKAGDLLAQIDAAPFKASAEQALAALKQNEALQGNAARNLKRANELASGKVLAPQELDTTRTQAAQYDAAVRNSKAALDSAEVQLGYTTITAPISGRTGLRQVDVGNLVQANGQNGIVTITQVQPIALIFTLPEQYFPRIQKAQPPAGQAGLKVLAMARDNQTVLGEGRLTVIDNQIDTTTGTIRLKAEFPNPELQLWPGQPINARLLVETRKEGLVVPASVIQRGPEGAFAYVVEGDKAVMRPVKVAQTEGNTALLDAGLRPGERVVVDGQYKLQPNAKVRVGEPPGRAGEANPKAAAARPDRTHQTAVQGNRP